jgi:hypothetical protein
MAGCIIFCQPAVWDINDRQNRLHAQAQRIPDGASGPTCATARNASPQDGPYIMKEISWGPPVSPGGPVFSFLLYMGGGIRLSRAGTAFSKIFLPWSGFVIFLLPARPGLAAFPIFNRTNALSNAAIPLWKPGRGLLPASCGHTCGYKSMTIRPQVWQGINFSYNMVVLAKFYE